MKYAVGFIALKKASPDREEHALAQRRPLARPAVVEDVRRVVEHAPETVAAEIAHHRAAVALGVILDGPIILNLLDTDRVSVGHESFLFRVFHKGSF